MGRARAVARPRPETPGDRADGAGQRPSEPQVAAVEPSPVVASPPPWELLQPLTVGAVVASGWRVRELSGAVHGSYVLTLENGRGRAERVHLCRNGGRPQGLVYTEQFDLVVMNGGQGEQHTDEGLAKAVAAVAHVVAANEGGRRDDSLLGHVERLEQFASAAALR